MTLNKDPAFTECAQRIIRFASKLNHTEKESSELDSILVKLYHIVKTNEYLMTDLTKASDVFGLEPLVLEVMRCLANILHSECKKTKIEESFQQVYPRALRVTA